VERAMVDASSLHVVGLRVDRRPFTSKALNLAIFGLRPNTWRRRWAAGVSKSVCFAYGNAFGRHHLLIPTTNGSFEFHDVCTYYYVVVSERPLIAQTVNNYISEHIICTS